MSHRWMYSVATVAASRTSSPAPSRNSRFSSRRSPPARFWLASAISIAPAWMAADARRQHHVRGADDLHVQPVGAVPPVVEGRRGQHRDRAPDRHPRAERRAEAPEANRRRALLRRAGKRGVEREPSARQARHHASQVDGQVRRRPERVAADRAVPRDVPDDAQDHAGRGEEDGVDGPREVPCSWCVPPREDTPEAW